ncbi:hypothetical protein BB559_002971 [Furculomyces boomerangus]|uniref:CDP-diacylglycerol--serine O-phosphatidyltransferase n=1 Tax=Furculomyces boomerangus TaxID=61424 RepID=A0A2T9YGH3_9FUNG|nr:hypothetical protein BB559_004138 [Furculomyces boomerangus]PVU94522.1 hypothetical protein BB559_002971 [Furculomyces boomerangus]
MVRSFNLADFLTLGNGVCGCMSIMFAMRSLITQDPTFLYAAFCFIPIGVFLDAMDGKVARWRNSTSLLGQELDSLADLISFGVAPAMLGFACGLQTILDIIVLSFFVCCGLARLARYNATVASLPKNDSGKILYFEGTPIPSSLFIVIVLAYGVYCGKFWSFQNIPTDQNGFISPFKIAFIGENVWLGELKVISKYHIHPFVFIYAINGMLMISKRLRIPKF